MSEICLILFLLNFLTAILLPSDDLRRVVFSYKREYVHGVLVNSYRLVKLAQEKVWLGELTVST